MAQDQVSHCPNCLAGYGWGVSVCTECGTQVVPGPSPAMGDAWADDPGDAGVTGGPGGIGGPAQVEVVRLPARSPSPDAEVGGGGEGEPEDLFGQEEHPVRVTLCRLEEDDAAGLVDALDEEGIGARLGETAADGTAAVMVHDTRLGEAQAVMVDWTGDPSMVDGVEFEGAAPAGETDPGRDGFVEVSSGAMSSVSLQAQRLNEEGIRARLVLPPEGADPTSAASGASLYVPRQDLTEARHILGMAV